MSQQTGSEEEPIKPQSRPISEFSREREVSENTVAGVLSMKYSVALSVILAYVAITRGSRFFNDEEEVDLSDPVVRTRTVTIQPVNNAFTNFNNTDPVTIVRSVDDVVVLRTSVRQAMEDSGMKANNRPVMQFGEPITRNVDISYYEPPTPPVLTTPSYTTTTAYPYPTPPLTDGTTPEPEMTPYDRRERVYI
ncbi:hypothetical protein DMENIID0001_104270 [Sergentomyia squamirostris]